MTEWQPQPGELVESLADGSWSVWGDGVTDNLAAGYASSVCKPLLPAANSMADAWDALKELPGARESIEYERLRIEVPVERGRFHLENGRPLNTMVFVPRTGSGNQRDYAARGRDYQKEGAIREWLKQVQP